MEHIAAIQCLIVGSLFAWSGSWKVFSPRARTLAEQSALGKLLPNRRLVGIAHFTVGIGEIALAGALLAVPPARWWAIRTATVFAVGFLVYLGLAWRIAPDRPCACMGGRATKISRRSLARAAALLIITLVGWSAPEFWVAAILAAPLVIIVIAGEMAGLWLLSPEFNRVGPRYGRRLAAMLSRSTRYLLDPGCSRMPLDWEQVERDLRGTFVFGQVAPHLDRRTDAWSEGCWRFITFGAHYQDRQATAVFAVPAIFDAEAISASLVDDEDGAVMVRLGSAHSRIPAAPEAVNS